MHSTSLQVTKIKMFKGKERKKETHMLKKENSKNRACDRLTNSSMKTISMEFMLCELLSLGESIVV